MATAPLSTDNTYLHTLEQAKQEFLQRNVHLSEQQRQQLWLQAAAGLPSNAFHSNASASFDNSIPRSMSAYSTPSTKQTPTPDPSFMGRTHSAPAPALTGRSMSNNSNIAQRSFSAMSAYQSAEDCNSYTLFSETASHRKQPALQPISETSTFDSNNIVEYDPASYVNTCIDTSSSPSLSFSQTHNTPQLDLTQLTQNSQWSPSIDGSSPSTPPTALMTPVTMSSSTMSRQSSFNPQYHDFPMLRIHSDSSTLYPLLPEDGSLISFSNVDAKNISACVDTSHFLTQFTGPASEVFPTPAHVSASASALASSQTQLYLAEDMRRSASVSSANESDASSASASSTSTRQSRRDREVNTQASRKIAPKAIASNETKTASSNVQMKRVLSEDGSSKDVAPITKAPYIRPHHPKIGCPHCDARPEGFRGTHELDRHVARAHATIRKGYICIDASPDKKFLANCKHCRTEKVYGAYYNAAAHLRRAHFHPRKRGRKGKNDEKRGGIGGGDDPPMDYLKQNWIREVEIMGEQKRKRRTTAKSDSMPFPDDTLDSATRLDDTESFDYESMDVSYAQPPATSMTNMLDFDQCVDPNNFIASNNGSCDSLSQFAIYDANSSTDINSFEFAAYTTQ